HRRLGVGGHTARRRPVRVEGHRLRDAVRSRVRALRRVRAVLHRPRARSGGGVRPRRTAGRAMSASSDPMRLFVSIPESLVDRPMLYEVIKRFDVVPSIRRANVETHSAWMILELGGAKEARDQAVAYLEHEGCTVNRMEGDVVAG